MPALVYKGKTYSSKKELATEFGIKPATLLYRLNKGYTIEEAITTELKPSSVPIQYNGKEYPSISSLAKQTGTDVTILASRIRNGWDTQRAVETPVTGPTVIEHEGITYHSVKDFARTKGLDYGSLSHFVNRSSSFDEALSRYEEQQTRKRQNELVLWGRKYESRAQLAREFGISPPSLDRQLQEGLDVASAVRLLLNKESILFLGKKYDRLSILCAEYNIQPANVTDRLQYGLSLYDAVTKPVRDVVRGKITAYRGVTYRSEVKLCRDYGISVTWVREQIRGTPYSFTDMANVFIHLKERVGFSKDHLLHYIPPLIMRGHEYTGVKLARELNVSYTSLCTYKSSHGFQDTFEALRSMQGETKPVYMYMNKGCTYTELRKTGLTQKMVNSLPKGQRPLYPQLENIDLKTGCIDVLHIYRNLCSELLPNPELPVEQAEDGPILSY